MMSFGSLNQLAERRVLANITPEYLATISLTEFKTYIALNVDFNTALLKTIVLSGRIDLINELNDSFAQYPGIIPAVLSGNSDVLNYFWQRDYTKYKTTIRRRNRANLVADGKEYIGDVTDALVTNDATLRTVLNNISREYPTFRLTEVVEPMRVTAIDSQFDLCFPGESFIINDKPLIYHILMHEYGWAPCSWDVRDCIKYDNYSIASLLLSNLSPQQKDYLYKRLRIDMNITDADAAMVRQNLPEYINLLNINGVNTNRLV